MSILTDDFQKSINEFRYYGGPGPALHDMIVLLNYAKDLEKENNRLTEFLKRYQLTVDKFLSGDRHE